MTTPPLFICGPTAAGKSRIALLLAEAFDGEIINADAFQLYRGLDVLTAAPGSDEKARVRHHLYGISDPGRAHDAESYRRLALPLITEVASRGKLPIVVGGSGLYLKFLTHGPSALPPGDPELRRRLEATPLPDLVRQLEELDPEGAGTVDRKNPRYVQRALEICLLTGAPASAQRRSFEQKERPDLRGLMIQWPRPDLHERIGKRTQTMLESGALAEVADLPEGSPADRAIGVSQIRAHLAGLTDLEACCEQIAAATRQYAKRQETWFRREKWLQPLPGKTTDDQVLAHMSTHFPDIAL